MKIQFGMKPLIRARRLYFCGKEVVKMVIEINIAALVGLLGIPTAITGFFFWKLENKIQKNEKRAEDQEKRREQYQLYLIKSVDASLALGEATARAVSRIPDAKCNGDMHAALDYAMEVKHQKKDFLNQQAIEALQN